MNNIVYMYEKEKEVGRSRHFSSHDTRYDIISFLCTTIRYVTISQNLPRHDTMACDQSDTFISTQQSD